MATKKGRERREIKYGSAKERAEKKSMEGRGTIKLPDGMSFYTVKDPKKVKFDIIPYVCDKPGDGPDAVQGGNPNVEEAGTVYFERTYWVHWGVGPKQVSVVCPAMTFGKKCCVCEEAARLRKNDFDAAKQFFAKERQLFYVIDRDKEDNEEVQVFDQSYHMFGKQLDAKVADSEEDDNYENFYHLDGGMRLRVSFEKKTIPGFSKQVLACANIEMKPRSQAIDESILEHLTPLDDLLVEVDPDTLKKMFEGEPEEDDQDDDAPKKKGPKAKAGKKADENDDDDWEEDEDEKEEEEDEDEPVKPAKKPGKAGKKPAPKKKPADEDEEEVEEEDTEDIDADEDDDWNDEEEEEKPAPKKPGKKPKK